jgi:hypothetical protein
LRGDDIQYGWINKAMGGKVSGTSVSTWATFGKLLCYLRRRAELTQRELGIAVGYSDGAEGQSP